MNDDRGAVLVKKGGSRWACNTNARGEERRLRNPVRRRIEVWEDPAVGTRRMVKTVRDLPGIDVARGSRGCDSLHVGDLSSVVLVAFPKVRQEPLRQGGSSRGTPGQCPRLWTGTRSRMPAPPVRPHEGPASPCDLLAGHASCLTDAGPPASLPVRPSRRPGPLGLWRALAGPSRPQRGAVDARRGTSRPRARRTKRALPRPRGETLRCFRARRRTRRRRRREEGTPRAGAIERASRPVCPVTREGPRDRYEREPRMTDRV